MRSKKGQLSIGSAPMVVLIVGLTFLVMATVALIGQKYGEAIPSSNTNSTINVSVGRVNETGVYVGGSSLCNFEDLVISDCINQTTLAFIPSTNYTYTQTGRIYYSGAGVAATFGFNNSLWNCSYTYNYAGTACDVNAELETNISENTSIAGIILTISLVGIILTLLIGVFLRIRTPRI